MLYFQKVILKNQRVQLTETGFKCKLIACGEKLSLRTVKDFPISGSQLLSILSASSLLVVKSEVRSSASTASMHVPHDDSSIGGIKDVDRERLAFNSKSMFAIW